MKPQSSSDLVWILDSDGTHLALVVSASFHTQGVQFLTPSSSNQQLALMSRRKGDTIPAHVHEQFPRSIVGTPETLFVRSGTLRIDFFSLRRDYISSAILQAGDLALLLTGGHGFEVLDDVELVEVKQGPFAEGLDKTRFTPDLSNLNIVFNSIC
jgi:hypothetical protein